MNAAIADTLVACDLAEARGDYARLTDAQRERLDRARAQIMAGDSAAAHVVSIVLDRVIAIPVYRWSRVERDFARMAAKAEARGLPVPALTEVSRTETHVLAHILGGAPVFRGWRLVADLESVTNRETGERRNLVRTAADEECPVEYRDAPEQCLHCGHARKRNRTYVIRHEDGRLTQVGSTCLDEYLGAEALESWLVVSRLMAAADGWIGEDWDDAEFARYRGHCSRWGMPVECRQFLAAVAAEVRLHGYTSSKTDPNFATGRTVWAALQEGEQTPVTEADEVQAEALLAMAERLPDTDFGHNVRTILGTGVVTWTDANMLAGLVPALAKEQARRDEHVPGAVVGESILGEWTVRRKASYFSEAFMQWKYTVVFADADGREIVWRTTAPDVQFKVVKDDATRRELIADHGGVEVQVGRTYRVTAKVKSLGEYEGFAQTYVTRASVYLPGHEAPSLKSAARKQAKAQGTPVPTWAMTDAQRKKAGR